MTKDKVKGASPTTDGAPILIENSDKQSLATLLVLLMLGTDELVQLINLLSVELDILKE